MEWKMEWNGEHTKLERLDHVTGAAQSRLSTLELLSHHRSFMSKYSIANHASMSKHSTVASSSSGALLL